MNKGSYRRYTIAGPGGFKCPCCVPEDKKARTIIKRQAKRREARALAKEQRE